jgi:hypothetical protein
MDNHETESFEPQPVAPAQATDRETAPSFLRRHAIGVGVAAAVLAVVVVAGGTAWGVSAAVAAAQPAPAAASAAMHGTAAAHKKAHGKRAAHGVVGTLTAVNGDTWTVKAASGNTVTVTLNSETAFGTKKAPATRGSFTTGSRVGVLGTRSGDTVTATRIVHLPLHAHTATPSPAPSV